VHAIEYDSNASDYAYYTFKIFKKEPNQKVKEIISAKCIA
jgi:hypothetical protein